MSNDNALVDTDYNRFVYFTWRFLRCPTENLETFAWEYKNQLKSLFEATEKKTDRDFTKAWDELTKHLLNQNIITRRK